MSCRRPRSTIYGSRWSIDSDTDTTRSEQDTESGHTGSATEKCGHKGGRASLVAIDGLRLTGHGGRLGHSYGTAPRDTECGCTGGATENVETSVAKRAPLPPTAYHTLLMADGSDTRAARHNRTYNVGTYVGGPAERCGHIGGEASPVTALGPRLTVHGGRPRHDGRARTQSTDGLQRPISPRNLPWISAPPRRRGGGGSGGGGGDDDDDDGGDDDDDGGEVPRDGPLILGRFLTPCGQEARTTSRGPASSPSSPSSSSSSSSSPSSSSSSSSPGRRLRRRRRRRGNA